MMNTTQQSRPVHAVRTINCNDSLSAHKEGHEVRPDVKWALVSPATGDVLVYLKNGATCFKNMEDPRGRALVMANNMVGLGFFKNTLDVPEELTTSHEGEDPCYLIEKPVNSCQAAYHRLRD